MGYTTGRRLTDEALREIAEKYKTRSDFQNADSSAYQTARKRGHDFLDSICDHMIVGSYSKPQLYCKVITEKLLGEKCMYNTKSIIKPYEIDVYFPTFKLAFEYNGKGWHFEDDVIERDKIKRKMCDELGITLIVISETNREYENDVKNEIIQNLDIINKVTNNSITENDVFSVDCSDVYDHVFKIKNLEDLDDKIAECDSIADFMRKHKPEYDVLMKNNKLSLLDSIRTRIEYSDEDLLEKCLEISDYSDFLRNYPKLYHRCHKRGLMEKATSHMTRKRRTYKYHSDEKLLEMANNFGMKVDLHKADVSLHYELCKRKLFDKVIFDPEFVYKTDAMLHKEEKVNNCYKQAKKYDNYEDFKNDEILYNTCKKYKIINQVTSHFQPVDIENLIIEKSKEYDTFSEFTKTEWYQKSKKFKGLTNKLKKINGWNFSSRKLTNFVEKYPDVVVLINDGVGITEISKRTNIDKTMVWRVKKMMESQGILKVSFKHKKPKSLAI